MGEFKYTVCLREKKKKKKHEKKKKLIAPQTPHNCFTMYRHACRSVMKRFEKKKKKKIPVITCQQKQASPLNITQTERTSASAFAGQPSPGYLPTVFPLVFFASNARSVPLRRFGTLALTVRER